MRVGQLLTSVSRRRSGIFEFTTGLSRRVAESGAESRVFGIRDPDTDADAHLWSPVRPFAARRVGPELLGLAPALLPALLEARLDVLHAHGLWTLQSVLHLLWAARARRPYVVSIHGMLNPWALGRSRGRKRVAGLAYERPRLRGARCVHTLGPHETRFLRDQGVGTPAAEIPYGIEVPDLAAPADPPPWSGAIEPGRPVLLYLGRLDPIKGLDDLVQAWGAARAAAGAGHWRLVIAGWGEPAYEVELRARAAASCGDGSILFAGPVFGAQREAAYRAAEACVLPSLSEGMPVGVLEAWARARPVLISAACHLDEGIAAGAGMAVGAGTDGVAAALRALFATSAAERAAMGARGRALIEARFSWPVVAGQFLELYRWLAGGGAPPASVRH